MSWLRGIAAADAFADAAGAPALVLHDLRVAMGGRVLIDRLSMSAAGGELWCVVGPNGAGKSTLLSVLAGLRAPDGGSVTLDGHALADWPVAVLFCRRRCTTPFR